MSDSFNRKLKAYEKGKLTGQDLEEFEKELEKLEEYHEVLGDKLNEQPGFNLSKRQQRIVWKGKWQARLQTAFTAIGILIVFIIFSTIGTALYYSWGNPNRADEFREVIDHTLTIINPYGYYAGGATTNTKPYFGLEATKDMAKVIGNKTVIVGELEVSFLFSSMNEPGKTYQEMESKSYTHFSDFRSSEEVRSDWDQLEKLPDGTVVSAYVSFAELMESKDVVQLFSDKQMELLWLAVDTGSEPNHNFGLISNPIGFPSYPIWHEDDMITESYTELNGWFFNKGWDRSSSSPAYKEGDQDVLHAQFIKTLSFLQKHEKKVNKLFSGNLNLDELITYLENNGILHYGAVITGPTKEILKLQGEPLVRRLEVDEVEFWNWN